MCVQGPRRRKNSRRIPILIFRRPTKTGTFINYRQVPDSTVNSEAEFKSQELGVQELPKTGTGLDSTSRTPWPVLNGLALLIQSPVQFKRGADQCQMRKRLREITKMLARRAQLFCEKAQVIGITQHLLEQESSSF